MVERCEKCGKPFMDKSEVNRHKMYEHIMPVSPFEENKEGATMYESINLQSLQRKETGNRNDSSHPEELQKSIITTTTSKKPINIDTTIKERTMIITASTIAKVSILPKIGLEDLDPGFRYYLLVTLLTFHTLI